MKNVNIVIRIVAIVFLLIIVVGYFVYNWFVQEVRNERDNAPFAVTVLATGKSDCIVIQIGGKVVLIDSGRDKNGEEVIAFLEKQGINDIDYFILSHPDKDHIGGADKIIRAMNVKSLIHSSYNPNTKQYKQYMKASEEIQLVPKILREPLDFSINEAHFTLYPPENLHYKEDNDYSLVLSVVYKENSFLFAGDAEEERLLELMSMKQLKHTFLKVPHHGKYNNQTKMFLEQVNPEYSVITSSDAEPPKKKTLAILDSLNSKTFLTSKGTVYCTSDGENLKIIQEI